MALGIVRGSGYLSYRIEGMDELLSSIDRLGKLPRKCVRGAARAGANVALKEARRRAPRRTGALRRGLKLREERSRSKARAIYQIGPDPKKNHLFAREYGAGKRAYYPASLEFGWRTRNGRREPGRYYLRDALVATAPEVERIIVAEMTRRIDAEWARGR